MFINFKVLKFGTQIIKVQSIKVQGIYNNRYTYQSCWNVFLWGKSGGGQQLTDLREFQSLLICNGV